MKIYLAARYSRREELRTYRDLLVSDGHTVTSRWLNESHDELEDAMRRGEDGVAQQRCADEDLEDVARADLLMLFADPPKSVLRGGKFVELGYALAKCSCVWIIGRAENVFGYATGVLRFDTFREARMELALQASFGPRGGYDKVECSNTDRTATCRADLALTS